MKEGHESKRDFLKFMGAGAVTLAGKAVHIDKLSHLVSEEPEEPKKEKIGELGQEELRTLELRIFPKIQEELRKPAWVPHSSTAGNTVYLTNQQWNDTYKILAKERKAIRDIFYTDMESIVEPRAKALGIEPDIYIMMAAKESNFGTSFLAQVANNPFSINIEGKQEILKEYMGKKTKWLDVKNEWDFFDFGNLTNACDAFEQLFKYWKGKSDYKHLKVLNNKQAIEIIQDNWGSGQNGSINDYEKFLERVTKRTY